MTGWSRREFLHAVVASPGVAPTWRTIAPFAAPAGGDWQPPCRVRTITAGVTLRDAYDLRPVVAALAALTRGRATFEDAGFEVQTIRVATSPFMAALDARARERTLDALRSLDRLLQTHGVVASIGPCSVDGRYDPELAPWVAELIRNTAQLSCSVRVSSAESGVYQGAARMTAEAMATIARITPDGIGNFRFAGAAHIPAGTPFFPVAFHQGPNAIALGLESASIVEQGVAEATSSQTATSRLRELLNRSLAPVERIGAAFAKREGRAYLGIDPSPAPGLDRSIGAAWKLSCVSRSAVMAR